MTIHLVVALAAWAMALLHAIVLRTWALAIERKPIDPDPLDAEELPIVSVILGVRNEADHIHRVLQDLYAQTYPREKVHVIMVDDGSEDDTFERASAMCSTWRTLQVIRSIGEGKKAALRTGVEMATGELFLMTDGDVRCGPGRIEHVVRAWLRTRPDMLILPVVMERSGRGPLELLQEHELHGLQGVALGSAITGSAMLASGANLAITRDAFRMAHRHRRDGPWSSGDDQFLLDAVLRSGGTVAGLADPEAAVRVDPVKEGSTYFAQRLRWAGKMKAMPTTRTTLFAAFELILPWMLLVVTVKLWPTLLPGHSMAYTVLLLGSAWVMWIAPILALSGTFSKRMGLSRSPLIALFLLPVWNAMAPIIAVASLFVRPKWKGRRI